MKTMNIWFCEEEFMRNLKKEVAKFHYNWWTETAQIWREKKVQMQNEVQTNLAIWNGDQMPNEMCAIKWADELYEIYWPYTLQYRMSAIERYDICL